MVSVGVSAHGRTNIHLIEPGVKVNGQYYRDVLLKQGLLPDIRDITDEYFIFQQDSAPAHRARDTVALLETETPDFIPPTLWPPNIRVVHRCMVKNKVQARNQGTLSVC